ncbi:hypothetical protein [Undibacterium sp. Ji49W]|uniref:hypothetical protein n=1 Tax=Undibacterium sp. Ji49W TaxID=3413040 RepID=UPI003BF1E507
MANIKVSGQGLFFSAPYSTAISFVQNRESGSFTSNVLQTQWTGINLSYNSTEAAPVGGTLTSFSVRNGQGVEQFSITGANYQIQPGDDLNKSVDVFARIVAGNDNWTGTSGSELFILGVGNDSFDGGAGLDTLLIQNVSNYFSINQQKMASLSPSMHQVGL